MKLHALPYVAHDVDMTRHYLSTTEIAERLGITRGALSSLTLPKPDVTVGTVRGWSEKTIDAWNEQRPGSGNRKPRKTAGKRS
ncbi:XRE family transcriptional regulator [Leucobacter sp. NPDC077196]|uniref:helix-turn-helix transcriptional regulator n=1 Tax=Leucobacter sp. NPDC077196 TaxID=3154959 RepID=UPI0034124B07